MKLYYSIFLATLMSMLAYRATFVMTSLSNVFYIVFIYFLWRAIYGDESAVINGLSFSDTFLYLALASTMFNIFKTWSEVRISGEVVSGDIIRYIVRPMDFQLSIFLESASKMVLNLIFIGAPIFFVVFYLSSPEPTSILSFASVVVVFICAFFISFQIDYLVGLSSFFAESVWGISMTKESIVLLLSGAIVPLAFFPSWMEGAMAYLPFQYIYHSPLTVVMANDLSLRMIWLGVIFPQMAWIAVMFIICRVSFRACIKKLCLNGG